VHILVRLEPPGVRIAGGKPMSLHPPHLGRRAFLRATGSVAAATLVSGGPAATLVNAAPAVGSGTALRELDAKIRAGMAKYSIPGVAVGVLHGGREYVRGYGVTNVDDPVPVDGDTVFRVASTTKTFTGTAVMRLVEQGRLDLDGRVRRYLPDFRTADPSVAARVTVRQLLNHTSGWLGDYFQDTGQGDDALAAYVAGIARLPQLTPPGTVFAYNNAGFGVAGRLIEVVTGKTCEQATRELLIDPLGLARSRFFVNELSGFTVAAPHAMVDGKPVVDPSLYAIPRALHPIGGLISSARDQLRYARFHLGDGRVPGGGGRLLTRQSLTGMRSRPGPGGTLFVELDGVGVTWMLRPSAEGVRVVQHGGDLPGQHSGFLMVPERGFAITVLTNSDSGPALLNELFVEDWALRRFAGIRNLPATPRALPASQLAAYEGAYTGQAVGDDGVLEEFGFELAADRGQLVVQAEGGPRLAFYRRDYALVLDETGQPEGGRVNFVRGADGQVAWLRVGGRLYRHGPSSDLPRTQRMPMSPPLSPYLI
jgi:CubicO group peptidase (beta-lactamase class C family)